MADVLSSATKSTAQTATGGLGLGAFSTGTLKTGTRWCLHTHTHTHTHTHNICHCHSTGFLGRVLVTPPSLWAPVVLVSMCVCVCVCVCVRACVHAAPTPSVPPTVNSRHVGNGSDRVGYNTNTTNNSTSSPQYRSQSPPSAYAPHTQHSKAHTAQQPGSYGSMDVGSGGGMGGGGHNSPPQAMDGREFFKQAR